eukprot:scaffold25518_cov74-Phaeocystis_antarctica.AAC.5
MFVYESLYLLATNTRGSPRPSVRRARVPRARVGSKVAVPASTWRARRACAGPARVALLFKAEALRGDRSYSVQSERADPRLRLAVVWWRLNVEKEATTTHIATHRRHGRTAPGEGNALGVGKRPPHCRAHQTVKVARPPAALPSRTGGAIRLSVLIQRVDSAEGNGHDVAPAEQREIVERRQRRKLHLARGQRVRPQRRACHACTSRERALASLHPAVRSPRRKLGSEEGGDIGDDSSAGDNSPRALVLLWAR